MKTNKFSKFFREWKWALMLVSICLAGIPLSTNYGIQSVTWGNDFWPNAFSEIMGMFIDLIFGAIFTFVVIDKYIQYHKNTQWKKIKNITYKNLYFLMSNILMKLNASFPKEMQVESYVLTEDIETLSEYLPKEDFDIVGNSLIQNINKIIETKYASQTNEAGMTASFEDENIHAALAKFKQHTKLDINSISSLVIPKLLNFSDNQILLDDVIELEELFTSWMSKTANVNRKNSNEHSDIKLVWLLQIQKILERIKAIADCIHLDTEAD